MPSRLLCESCCQLLTWAHHPAARDLWHEYDLPPEATFAQLKIPVLRHWNILPSMPSSRPVQYGNSKAACPAAVSHPRAFQESITSGVQQLSSAASRPQTRRGTLKGPNLSSPPFSTSESLEELRTTLPGTHDGRKRSSWTPTGGSVATGYASMQKDMLHECAQIMGNYAFRSVCSGCFLPEEAVLSKRCVEYDLLVVSCDGSLEVEILLETQDMLTRLSTCFDKDSATFHQRQHTLQSLHPTFFTNPMFCSFRSTQ